MRPFVLAAAAMLLALPATLPAHAALELSGEATRNVSCADGTCAATDADAVLNVSDLAGMLATADTRVETAQGLAQDLVVASPLAWSSSHALSLQSANRLVVRATIAVQGQAHLDVEAAGGAEFERGGAIKFASAGGRLTIGGVKYKLLRSIAGIAAAVAAHPRGTFALADDYDAQGDGTWRATPVQGEFRGIFDGLGNRIANFSLWDTADGNIALFEAVVGRGTIRNLGMTNVHILAENTFNNTAGSMVAYHSGTMENCYADGGMVRTDFLGTVGGLVGQSYGRIARSWANIDVEGAQGGAFGGLVGNAHGHVEDSYAVGQVDAGDNTDVGGLVGYSFGRVRGAYATTHVVGGHNARVGGFEGTAQVAVRRAYWNIETSGTGVGIASGLTQNVVGLTTGQLQSGLPKGFDPAIWALDPAVNGGMPYLLSNPPR